MGDESKLPEVMAYGWDQSRGLKSVATAITWLMTLEKQPKYFDHVGIAVFGYFYEYGESGVRAQPLGEKGIKPDCPVFSAPRKLSLGITGRTKEEFDEWTDSSKQRCRSETFDFVHNNCLTWAKDAAEFLGVKPHPNWDILIAYMKRHESLVYAVTGHRRNKNEKL